jgi:pyruvyltransferase
MTKGTLNKISKVFYINLDRREDRREHLEETLNFKAERFRAVDSKSIELDEEIRKLFPSNYHKLKKSEIACCLSHYALWQKLASDKDAENYLILEDDVVFKSGFKGFWNAFFSENMPKDYFLIYLGGCQPWNKIKYHEVIDPYNQYFNNIKKNNFFTKDDHYWHMNAQSYVLSKRAASLMCQWVEQHGFAEALDIFMINFVNDNKLFSAQEKLFHLNPLMTYQMHEENDNPAADKNSDIRFDEEKFKHDSVKNEENQLCEANKIKMIWQNPGGKNGCYERDWILELFEDVDLDHIDDPERLMAEDNSIVVYSDMFSEDPTRYPEHLREKLNTILQKQKSYFRKFEELDNCFLVHLCDEYCQADVEHYKYFKHVFRNYYRSDVEADNITFLPLGYKRELLKKQEQEKISDLVGIGNDNVEVDKNSDLRYADEEFKGDKKNILYWRSDKGFGNFGDELNVPVGKFLFGDNITFNKKNIPGSIRLIGSNLGDVKNEDLACGVGIHHHSQKMKSTLADYRCVRGPLSLKYLQSRGVSIKNIFLGDPALLLKAFYEPIINKELKDKIGVVPHISNIDYFKHQVDQLDGFYLINPTNNWEQVVSEIYSCKSVISSSLHGLICADAYDKPNVWIKVPGKSIPPCDENTDNGDFKYWDYFMSQGRQIKFINSIHDNLGGKLYEDGNNINLNKLKNSILGKNIEEVDFPNLINISNKQIPKKIHLSWKNKNILDSDSYLISNGVGRLQKLNPGWDIQVSDDEDVDKFLRDSIGLDHWNLIKDKKIVEKTDLWRLLKIHQEGGLYIDIDRYINIPIDDIIKPKTKCVIPVFKNVDFSQDFILSAPKSEYLGVAIANNLKNRKDGKPLFYTAVYSYMHSVSRVLSGEEVDRNPGQEYWNKILPKLESCEYIETKVENGPFDNILFQFNIEDFNFINSKTNDPQKLIQEYETQKGLFYNEQNVKHWNQDDQNKFNKLNER